MYLTPRSAKKEKMLKPAFFSFLVSILFAHVWIKLDENYDPPGSVFLLAYHLTEVPERCR